MMQKFLIFLKKLNITITCPTEHMVFSPLLLEWPTVPMPVRAALPIILMPCVNMPKFSLANAADTYMFARCLVVKVPHPPCALTSSV